MNYQNKGFKNPGKCLKTKKGFMVNYHGFCFFVTEKFEYQPWCPETKKPGTLPPTNEYGRLKSQGLKERFLTEKEEILAGEIASKLRLNPRMHTHKQPTAVSYKMGEVKGFSTLRKIFA